MTEINLCSDTQEEQSTEINLCSSEQDREINLCPGECPDVLPELFLTGTDTPGVGSTYTATGGVSPYSYSISCGAISTTGEITDLSGCCGTGTVSVTDACGQTVTKDVRFASGYWNQYSSITYCNIPGGNFTCWETIISGSTKIEQFWASGPDGDDYIGCKDVVEAYPGYIAPPCRPTAAQHYMGIVMERFYSWDCP